MAISEQWRMRSPTFDDIEAYVVLDNDVYEALIGVRPTTAQNVKASWQSPNFNLENSSRAVFDTSGKMIGMVIVWDNGPVPVLNYINLTVHPDYEATDLGAQLLTWPKPVPMRLSPARQNMPR